MAKKIETDLAIIAAGPAGLAASVAAAELGVKVDVFEKSAIPGGTANMGMGPFAVESPVQKDQMIGITKEEAFKLMMDYTHWQVDAKLVHDYFWQSGDTIRWLQDMGVKFAYASKMYPEGEATWHVVQPDDGGRPSARAATSMNRVIHEHGVELGVNYHFECPVKKIISDGKKVSGLIATDKDGEDVEVSAKAVIVATGGFGSNAEMIKDYTDYTLREDMYTFEVPGIVGDGIKMAWEAGAGKGHMEMERILGSEIPGLGQFHFSGCFHQGRVLVVSPFGERVMDESIIQNGAVTANVIMQQKDRCIYSVITDGIVKYIRKHGEDFPNNVFHLDPTEGFEEEIPVAQEQYPKTVFIADSVEELAEKMGMDPKVLAATVERYNEQCEQNYDDDFCKDRKYLTKLTGKKWYAYKYRPGAYGSLGGIKINSRLEILREDWEKIDGFYGAGSDVCAIYAGTYQYKLAGNTMGFAVNTGRMAGTRAAEYILDNK